MNILTNNNLVLINANQFHYYTKILPPYTSVPSPLLCTIIVIQTTSLNMLCAHQCKFIIIALCSYLLNKIVENK